MAFCHEYKIECSYAVAFGSERCFCGPEDKWPCEHLWSEEKKAFVYERKLIVYMAKCCGLHLFVKWLGENGYQYEREVEELYAPCLGPNRIYVKFKTPAYSKESVRCCFAVRGDFLSWDM